MWREESGQAAVNRSLSFDWIDSCMPWECVRSIRRCIRRFEDQCSCLKHCRRVATSSSDLVNSNECIAATSRDTAPLRSIQRTECEQSVCVTTDEGLNMIHPSVAEQRPFFSNRTDPATGAENLNLERTYNGCCSPNGVSIIPNVPAEHRNLNAYANEAHRCLNPLALQMGDGPQPYNGVLELSTFKEISPVFFMGPCGYATFRTDCCNGHPYLSRCQSLTDSMLSAKRDYDIVFVRGRCGYASFDSDCCRWWETMYYNMRSSLSSEESESEEQHFLNDLSNKIGENVEILGGEPTEDSKSSIQTTPEILISPCSDKNENTTVSYNDTTACSAKYRILSLKQNAEREEKCRRKSKRSSHFVNATLQMPQQVPTTAIQASPTTFGQGDNSVALTESLSGHSATENTVLDIAAEISYKAINAAIGECQNAENTKLARDLNFTNSEDTDLQADPETANQTIFLVHLTVSPALEYDSSFLHNTWDNPEMDRDEDSLTNASDFNGTMEDSLSVQSWQVLSRRRQPVYVTHTSSQEQEPSFAQTGATLSPEDCNSKYSYFLSNHQNKRYKLSCKYKSTDDTWPKTRATVMGKRKVSNNDQPMAMIVENKWNVEYEMIVTESNSQGEVCQAHEDTVLTDCEKDFHAGNRQGFEGGYDEQSLGALESLRETPDMNERTREDNSRLTTQNCGSFEMANETDCKQYKSKKKISRFSNIASGQLRHILDTGDIAVSGRISHQVDQKVATRHAPKSKQVDQEVATRHAPESKHQEVATRHAPESKTDIMISCTTKDETNMRSETELGIPRVESSDNKQINITEIKKVAEPRDKTQNGSVNQLTDVNGRDVNDLMYMNTSEKKSVTQRINVTSNTSVTESMGGTTDTSVTKSRNKRENMSVTQKTYVTEKHGTEFKDRTEKEIVTQSVNKTEKSPIQSTDTQNNSVSQLMNTAENNSVCQSTEKAGNNSVSQSMNTAENNSVSQSMNTAENNSVSQSTEKAGNNNVSQLTDTAKSMDATDNRKITQSMDATDNRKITQSMDKTMKSVIQSTDETERKSNTRQRDQTETSNLTNSTDKTGKCVTQSTNTMEKCVTQSTDKTGKNVTQSTDKTGKCVTQSTDKTGKCVTQSMDKTGKCVTQSTDKTGKCVTQPTDKTGKCVTQSMDKTGKCVTQSTDKTEKCVTQSTDKMEKCVTQSTDNTGKCVTQSTDKTEKCVTQSTDKTGECVTQSTDTTEKRDVALGQDNTSQVGNTIRKELRKTVQYETPVNYSTSYDPCANIIVGQSIVNAIGDLCSSDNDTETSKFEVDGEIRQGSFHSSSKFAKECEHGAHLCSQSQRNDGSRSVHLVEHEKTCSSFGNNQANINENCLTLFESGERCLPSNQNPIYAPAIENSSHEGGACGGTLQGTEAAIYQKANTGVTRTNSGLSNQTSSLETTLTDESKVNMATNANEDHKTGDEIHFAKDSLESRLVNNKIKQDQAFVKNWQCDTVKMNDFKHKVTEAQNELLRKNVGSSSKFTEFEIDSVHLSPSSVRPLEETQASMERESDTVEGRQLQQHSSPAPNTQLANQYSETAASGGKQSKPSHNTDTKTCQEGENNERAAIQIRSESNSREASEGKHSEKVINKGRSSSCQGNGVLKGDNQDTIKESSINNERRTFYIVCEVQNNPRRVHDVPAENARDGHSGNLAVYKDTRESQSVDISDESRSTTLETLFFADSSTSEPGLLHDTSEDGKGQQNDAGCIECSRQSRSSHVNGVVKEHRSVVGDHKSAQHQTILEALKSDSLSYNEIRIHDNDRIKDREVVSSDSEEFNSFVGYVKDDRSESIFNVLRDSEDSEADDSLNVDTIDITCQQKDSERYLSSLSQSSSSSSPSSSKSDDAARQDNNVECDLTEVAVLPGHLNTCPGRLGNTVNAQSPFVRNYMREYNELCRTSFETERLLLRNVIYGVHDCYNNSPTLDDNQPHSYNVTAPLLSQYPWQSSVRNTSIIDSGLHTNRKQEKTSSERHVRKVQSINKTEASQQTTEQREQTIEYPDYQGPLCVVNLCSAITEETEEQIQAHYTQGRKGTTRTRSDQAKLKRADLRRQRRVHCTPDGYKHEWEQSNRRGTASPLKTAVLKSTSAAPQQLSRTFIDGSKQQRVSTLKKVSGLKNAATLPRLHSFTSAINKPDRHDSEVVNLKSKNDDQRLELEPKKRIKPTEKSGKDHKSALSMRDNLTAKSVLKESHESSVKLSLVRRKTLSDLTMSSNRRGNSRPNPDYSRPGRGRQPPRLKDTKSDRFENVSERRGAGYSISRGAKQPRGKPNGRGKCETEAVKRNQSRFETVGEKLTPNDNTKRNQTQRRCQVQPRKANGSVAKKDLEKERVSPSVDLRETEASASDGEYMTMIAHGNISFLRDIDSWREAYNLKADDIESEALKLLSGDLSNLYDDLSEGDIQEVKSTIRRMKDMSNDDLLNSL